MVNGDSYGCRRVPQSPKLDNALLPGMLKKVKVKANKTKSNEVDNGSPLNAARNASSTPKESKSESK